LGSIENEAQEAEAQETETVMQGQTHLAWGALAGLVVAQIGSATGPEMALCAAVGGLAGLVPDWLQVNVPGVKQVKGAFGHRGFSHWLWTPLGLAFLGRAVAPGSLLGAFVAGWVSHILLDALSNGAPVFWPFGRLTLGRIKTGGRLDTFTGAAAVVVGLVIVTMAAG